MASRIVQTRILLAVGALVMSVCYVLLFAPTTVSAAPGLTRVQGHVYDPYEDPAVGADVFVEFLNKDTGDPRARTWDGVTDSNGYYQTTNWGPSDWEVGDTVRVTVTYNSEQEIETKVSLNIVVQVVDVHYPTAIPQLGGLVGSLIAMGLVAVLAVVFIQKKSCKTS